MRDLRFLSTSAAALGAAVSCAGVWLALQAPHVASGFGLVVLGLVMVYFAGRLDDGTSSMP
ncbi:MAG TPA: hypothetical protein VFH47_07510 [Candidatus Thermoplasmatota archaeon]|nr:hypothetical protein [Candidatus Thermoplasmatota archaeon]